MKRFFSIFLCFLIMSFCPMLSACDNSNDDTPPIANPEYYLAIGYHKITFDCYSKIIYDNENSDKVEVDDNTIMLPHNSSFKIEFNLENNDSFTLNNSNYINLNDGKVLSGFSIGNKTYGIDSNLTLKNDINISATFENIKPVGVAILTTLEDDNSLESNVSLTGKFDEFPQTFSNLLYFYSSTGTLESFNSKNILTNSTYQVSTIAHEDNFDLNLKLEVFIDTISVSINLILADENNNFYFLTKSTETDFVDNEIIFNNLANDTSKLNKISLTLCYDLSSANEYLK